MSNPVRKVRHGKRDGRWWHERHAHQVARTCPIRLGEPESPCVGPGHAVMPATVTTVPGGPLDGLTVTSAYDDPAPKLSPATSMTAMRVARIVRTPHGP